MNPHGKARRAVTESLQGKTWGELHFLVTPELFGRGVSQGFRAFVSLAQRSGWPQPRSIILDDDGDLLLQGAFIDGSYSLSFRNLK